MDDVEILDDDVLARRWLFDGSPEAIARRLDRISDKKRAGHLKCFKGGNKRLYRIEDVREYESRAKFMLFRNSAGSDVKGIEVRKHDPSVYEGLLNWLDVRSLP